MISEVGGAGVGLALLSQRRNLNLCERRAHLSSSLDCASILLFSFSLRRRNIHISRHCSLTFCAFVFHAQTCALSLSFCSFFASATSYSAEFCFRPTHCAPRMITSPPLFFTSAYYLHSSATLTGHPNHLSFETSSAKPQQTANTSSQRPNSHPVPSTNYTSNLFSFV